MAETNLSFSGSIPQLYDRYLGPVFFEPYAADLARRVAAPCYRSGVGDGLWHWHRHSAVACSPCA